MRMIRTFIYRFGNVQYDLALRTHIMGILNVTPDSFSDGQNFFNPSDAVEHALQIQEEGADIIDIGGESSRPGSENVSIDEELRRVIPVIERLSEQLRIPISIDTCKSEVAEQALTAGALIVNDISGLRYDPHMAAVVSRHNATVIVMHMKGTPKTMQVEPVYVDLINEVCSFLQQSIQTAEEHGITQVIIDPGIGFGKTVEHNLHLIRNLKELQRFEFPVLVGPSRKSFIGAILGAGVNERLEGTAGAVAASIMNGAHIVRVHDVKQIKRVAGIVDAIVHA
jgi:dihydropteroate synthase